MGAAMSKYAGLGEYLKKQPANEIPVTFAEIERITGTRLPPKAQHHRAWWSNNASNNVMTRVWLAAGYQTERVDVAGRKLVFRRVRSTKTSSSGVSSTAPGSPAPGPSGHHPLFGALKDLIHIAPGTDLTEPADPQWGDRAWGHAHD